MTSPFSAAHLNTEAAVGKATHVSKNRMADVSARMTGSHSENPANIHPFAPSSLIRPMDVRRQTATRVQEIAPFHVMEVQTAARALEAAGRDVVHMEIGEPDFPTP